MHIARDLTILNSIRTSPNRHYYGHLRVRAGVTAIQVVVGKVIPGCRLGEIGIQLIGKLPRKCLESQNQFSIWQLVPSNRIPGEAEALVGRQLTVNIRWARTLDGGTEIETAREWVLEACQAL